MLDGTQGAVSGQASQGAPTTEQNSAPLTKADLEGVVATFSEQLGKVERSLQRGTDKQIAQTRTEFTNQIRSVAEELGVSVRSLLAASGADDDTKRVVAAQLDEGSRAARSYNEQVAYNTRIIEDTLRSNGLTEDDLDLPITDYAVLPNRKMLDKDIAKALKGKPKVEAKPDAKVTVLEAQIKELQDDLKRAKGEDVVTVGSAGAAGRNERPLTATELLHNPALMKTFDDAVKKKAASKYTG